MYVLLAYALSLCLALLEGVLVLKFASHLDGRVVLVDDALADVSWWCMADELG